MNISGWIQLVLFVAALLAITKPLGLYLCQVLDADGKTFLDPVLKPVETADLQAHRRGPDTRSRTGSNTRIAMLLFSLVRLLFTYAILRLQRPAAAQLRRGLGRASARTWRSTPPPASPPTPTGRATAANPRCPISRRWSRWRSTTSSRRPTGIAIAAALVRGIARHSAKTLGNFWVDLVRTTFTCCCPSAWSTPCSSCRRA